MCRAIFARPVTNAAFRGGLDAITIHKAGLTSLRADVLALTVRSAQGGWFEWPEISRFAVAMRKAWYGHFWPCHVPARRLTMSGAVVWAVLALVAASGCLSGQPGLPATSLISGSGLAIRLVRRPAAVPLRILA
jgi:hypothetical protein